MFHDRIDAGKQLAARLTHLRSEGVVVVGLPRGGVPVAEQVARELDAPLDVILVRKLGLPFQPEVGMGAIGEDDVRVLNDEVMRMAKTTPSELATVEASERVELERRARRFRAGRSRIPLAGRVVVVVDDGIATGSTAKAACQVAREAGARRIVLAVPVAPREWIGRLTGAADELIAVSTPSPFSAIGRFYRDFTQTSDEEVVRCLDRAAARQAAGGDTEAPRQNHDIDDDRTPRDDDIQIDVGHVRLDGHLIVPEQARAIVVFAHGSGSSRHSPRNRYVASVLNDVGLATLLFDLLTVEEAHDRANVFDLDLLGDRLADVTRRLHDEPSTRGLPVAYFGASTGAAAALRAATEPGLNIVAVVSRGGRPDLAYSQLPDVQSPTLLIVGGDDRAVLDLNEQARARLRCESNVAIVPGASHLFEEPGTLQAAAELTRDWFLAHLGRRSDSATSEVTGEI